MVLLVCFMIIFSISLLRILFISLSYSKDMAQYHLMEEWRTDGIPSSENSGSYKKEAQRLHKEKLQRLKEQNEDFLGWLSIEGTRIHYPVMVSPYDAEFYLKRNFEKEYSRSGTPFAACEATCQYSNLLIHGHNMKNGTMFSDLLQYREEGFCREHPVIVFETPQEVYTYKIIAAFPVEITSESGRSKFHCYDYAGELSKELFETYIENVKTEALYDTGESIQYGERLLTLSTCSYHAKNGRFVVVAQTFLEEGSDEG